MTAEIIARIDEIGDHSPEWHRIRQSGIGGSDAPIVAGLSKWRSPYDLWVDKIGPAKDGDEDTPEHMHWGHLLEEPIAQEFSRRTDLRVESLPVIIRSTEHPFMLANVDRVVVNRVGEPTMIHGPLEIKTTRFADDWPVQDDGTVSVPLWVMAQGMHYLAVGGWEQVWFACLIGGQELRIAEVKRTETLIDDLVAIEADFFDKVRRRVAPALDGSEATRRALGRRWTPQDGKAVDLPERPSRFLLTERRRLLTEVAERTELVKEIENELCVLLGDAEAGMLDTEKAVTWPGIERRTIDSKALRAAHPQIAEEFTKTSSYRRFGVAKTWRPEKGADDGTD